MIRFVPQKYTKILDENIAAFLHTFQKDKLNTLLIVQVGDNAESKKYVSLKKAFCEKFSIPVEVLNLSAALSDEEISNIISDKFNQTSVGGGIIQLPLPRKSLSTVLDLIPSEKDSDLLSSKCLHNFYLGDFYSLSPVIRAFNFFVLESSSAISNRSMTFDKDAVSAYVKKIIKNKTVTVIGNGFLVGRPIAFYVSHLGANVNLIENYKEGDKIDTDYLILATDVPYLVKGPDIAPKTNVVDFGSSVVDSVTVGNLDTNTPLDHLNLISFSPGGMGPLVVRCLVCNFLGI